MGGVVIDDFRIKDDGEPGSGRLEDPGGIDMHGTFSKRTGCAMVGVEYPRFDAAHRSGGIEKIAV